MRYSFTIFFVFILISPSVLAQNGSADDYKYSSLAFSLDYTSDNSINGRTSIFGSQPNLSSLTSYYFPWGLDVSLMCTNIWNADESGSKSAQELGLSLGYSYDFNDWLSAYASYSHFSYSKNSNALNSVYEHAYATGISSELKWWTADITGGYYTGTTNELFLSLETGISIDFDNVFHKDNMLSFEPNISAYLGNISYYNTDAYSNYLFLYNYASDFPNITVDEFIENIKNPETNRDRILRNRLLERPQKLRKLSELPGDLVIWDLFKEQNEFNFNTIGFTFPVYYYWNDFMLNISYSAFKPINQPSYIEEEWSSYINMGVTYMISW